MIGKRKETKTPVEQRKKKKKEFEKEPQFYRSAVNIPAENYRVYYLTARERILYTLAAFLVGAVVGYLFYGGIGKDEFQDPTGLTYICDIVVMAGVGFLAAKFYPGIRENQLLKKRQNSLKRQFRDMLETLTTALNAGRNIRDAFAAAQADLKNQYDEGSFILNELNIIITGMNNGINTEDLLTDFGKRSGCTDIEDFANVFEISNRRGGNLKDVIRNTYEILSDKMTVAEDIETMVTGSKSELVLMLVLPAVMVALIKFSSADFAANMTSPAGLASTTIALAFTVVAFLLARKILDFGIS